MSSWGQALIIVIFINIKTLGGYGFKYPHPEVFPSSRIRGTRFVYKNFYNHLLTHYDSHLKNVDGKSFAWVLPYLLHSFATFVVVSPESESTYWIPYSIHIAYILNITNLIWKKVNQVFVITIKRVIYLINFLGHKTLKSVSLFYVATSFTSALPATKCTFFTNKWEIHFSST